MKKPEQAAHVKAICAYLDGIGHPISTVQGYEVLARSLGYKNKHLLAQVDDSVEGTHAAKVAKIVSVETNGVPPSVDIRGVSVPVMSLTANPLSIEHMKALDWTFDIIVPISLEATGNVDAMNDSVSSRITGVDYALCDIGYDHIPGINYGVGWAAYRVNGYVESPEDHFDVVSNENANFYADLLELANCIVGNASLTVAPSGGQGVKEVVYKVNARSKQLLQDYARGNGANNEVMNLYALDNVIECKYVDHKTSLGDVFFLHELKYAIKVGDRTWNVRKDCVSVTLQFPL